MGRPYVIPKIVDLAASVSAQNILSGEALAKLQEDSIVAIYGLRETVDVKAQILIGPDEVFPNSGFQVNATVGSVPSTKDNLVCSTIGRANEEIQIKASNADGANAREISVLVAVIPEKVAVAVPQFLQLFG